MYISITREGQGGEIIGENTENCAWCKSENCEDLDATGWVYCYDCTSTTKVEKKKEIDNGTEIYEHRQSYYEVYDALMYCERKLEICSATWIWYLAARDGLTLADVASMARQFVDEEHGVPVDKTKIIYDHYQNLVKHSEP